MSTHPPHRLARFPTWINRWLGYRATPPPKQPDHIIWLWSFIGAFGGLSLLQAVFGQASYFIKRGVPSIIASYAASAVLIYGAVDSPLAQPRALVGGHFIAALIGVCITKLFGLLHNPQRLDELRWLAASLSTSVAIVLMQMTGTTHPPAGATALLAAVNQPVYDIGWYYLPVVLLSSTLMLVVALITNNVQRRYPVFWFQPAVVIPAKPSPALDGTQVEGKRGQSDSPTPTVSATPVEKDTDAVNRV
ncbi:hypothetical protein JAAARDRAFT_145037 [Jaapia argillacea MUCL 33604]|uniref:HPP transmembrane region domain-containing protein n=1 Tax=Jaapia argillacea MUCL 33604 TaxID=933084 RepID=A0A067QE18_9AGAM|nr:hypothetical protein JAAARDRAFT_145037 [Jaapia argillacea MUCL 33604]